MVGNLLDSSYAKNYGGNRRQERRKRPPGCNFQPPGGTGVRTEPSKKNRRPWPREV